MFPSCLDGAYGFWGGRLQGNMPLSSQHVERTCYQPDCWCGPGSPMAACLAFPLQSDSFAPFPQFPPEATVHITHRLGSYALLF